MHKQVFYFTVSLFFVLYSACAFAEDITITTYYPSPNGSYSSLQTDRLGVGDNNGDALFTSADVPTTTGDVWIKGNVGIGTGTTSPGVKLQVDDIQNAESLIRLRNNRQDFGDVSIFGIVGQNSSTDVAKISFYRGGGGNSGYLTFSTKETNVDSLTEKVRINGAGYVGIGTTSPTKTLQIGNSSNSASVYNDYIATINNMVFESRDNNDGGAFVFRSNSDAATTNLVQITRFGNVGIGTTSPTYQLQLSTDSAAKPSTNTWTIASDSRIKKDIRPYTNGLSIIKRINPVWFKYNGKAGFPNDNQEHIGVIAQEIVKVAPYTVNTFKAKLNSDDKKETELLNFNSHALTFDLINAVKELDSNITKLTQENQDLKKENQELKSEVENLKVRLNRLETRIK